MNDVKNMETVWAIMKEVAEEEWQHMSEEKRAKVQAMQSKTIYISYFTKEMLFQRDLDVITICGEPPEYYRGAKYEALDAECSFYINESQHTVVQDFYNYSEGVPFVLLCCESPKELCSKHFVAEWLRIAGYTVEEI